MNLEGFEPAAIDLDRLELSDADRWILTRLDETIDQTGQALDEYKFNEAASTLYAFTWHSFCDWYIELAKDDLYGDDPQARTRVQCVLFTVLEQLLRLLHPIMPFHHRRDLAGPAGRTALRFDHAGRLSRWCRPAARCRRSRAHGTGHGGDPRHPQYPR